MSNIIQAIRTELSSVFPIPSFRIRTDTIPAWGEVAVATSPDLLFDPAAQDRRTPGNFYSSRSSGLFPIERGETVYLLPPEVTSRFAGNERLHYGLAVYPRQDPSDPQVKRPPVQAVPFINISNSYRGTPQGILGMPQPRGGLTGNGYGNGGQGVLQWGGDMAPAGEMVTVPAPGNGNGSGVVTAGGNGETTLAGSGNGGSQAEANPTAAQNGVAIAYDDGFAPDLWSRPQAVARRAPEARSLAIVQPDYVPSNPQDAAATIRQFAQRYDRWRAGVPDTRIFPHSAICHMVMNYPDGNYVGTGFFIDDDRILTCAHNVRDVPTNTEASTIRITPGRNGTTDPFGSFTVRSGDWEVHPLYDGGWDYDLAVIRVNTPPPNGLYFDVLEDLRQSIPEKITVCGYAARTGDENKQNLDGDTVRDVSPNLERIRYNLQTEPGNSGSPVFYLTGVEDPVQQMSVASFPVIGVHVSAYDQTLNQACRLSEEKIAWIRAAGRGSGRTQALGSQELHEAKRQRIEEVPRVETEPVPSEAQAAAEIGGAIVGAVITRILDNEGDVSWELEQMRGLKHPQDDPGNQGEESFATTTLNVPGPESGGIVDEISADFEVRFQHNGRSLGNVQITNTRANDAVGWGLHVKAQIMDDANVYEGRAAINVQFHYRFTRSVGSDVIGVRDMKLYADGTFDDNLRWTQHSALALGNGKPIDTARAAGGGVAGAVAGPIIETLLTTVVDGRGDIQWTLEQLDGVKYPQDNRDNAGTGPFRDITVDVPGLWVENMIADRIQAQFQVRWQYNGRALGNIEIVNTRTNDAAGWGLNVNANIVNDSRLYLATGGGGDTFAAIGVNFSYHFTRWPRADVIGQARLKLYGNGTHDVRYEWTQE